MITPAYWLEFPDVEMFADIAREVVYGDNCSDASQPQEASVKLVAGVRNLEAAIRI